MADAAVITAKYGTIITDIGKAKIAAAILAGEKVNITHVAVGDGGGAYYKPTTGQTDLINECWRGEISSASIGKNAPNMIDIKFVVPADQGGYTIREGMAIDSDGDVIAIWNTPDVQKVSVVDGVSFPLTMITHIIVEDASVVTVTVNPSLDTVSREEMEQAIEAHNADIEAHEGIWAAIRNAATASRFDITLPADGWIQAEAPTEDYTYICDVEMEGVTTEHWPTGGVNVGSFGVAGKAGVVGGCETMDGYVRFYSKRIPTDDIYATIGLISTGQGGIGAAGGTTTVKVLDQAEYDALEVKDETTLYFIRG